MKSRFLFGHTPGAAVDDRMKINEDRGVELSDLKLENSTARPLQ